MKKFVIGFPALMLLLVLVSFFGFNTLHLNRASKMVDAQSYYDNLSNNFINYSSDGYEFTVTNAYVHQSSESMLDATSNLIINQTQTPSDYNSEITFTNSDMFLDSGPTLYINCWQPDDEKQLDLGCRRPKDITYCDKHEQNCFIIARFDRDFNMLAPTIEKENVQ